MNQEELNQWYENLSSVDPKSRRWLVTPNEIQELLSQKHSRLKAEVAKSKYTFHEVDWGDDLKSLEPVEDTTKSLQYAQGFNQAIDQVIELIDKPNGN